VCTLNAAQCLLKLKLPGEARAECNAVLKEDEGNARAYYRRCLAHLDLKCVCVRVCVCVCVAHVDLKYE
jgi:hypothetical protein